MVAVGLFFERVLLPCALFFKRKQKPNQTSCTSCFSFPKKRRNGLSGPSGDQALIEKSIALLSELPAFQDRSSVIVSKIQGGCSNQLYTCTSTSSGAKVVIRFYGSDLVGEGNSHKPTTEEEEAAMMRKLADQDLYPTILKVFPGGRIEEFVEGRPPTISEANSLPLNLVFMKKLAAIHSMKDMPTSDVPPMFKFDTLETYMAALETIENQFDEDDRQAVDFVQKFDFRKECDWLQQVFQQVKSRVVFSHNDMHKDNIMLNSDGNNNISDSEMLVMDYEYASANYRWADLAIYLTELSFQSYDEETGELTVPHAEPSFMETILQRYLDEWKRLNPQSYDANLDNLSHLLYEAAFGEMIIHYARVLWFCGHVGRNYGALQNWKYTRLRLMGYLDAKADFMQKYCTNE